MIAYGILWPSIARDSEILRRRIEEALSDALLKRAGIVLREAA